MAENSKIQCTDHTFNPWWGCLHAGSPGCDNCYARSFSKQTNFDFSKRTKTKGPWKDIVKFDRKAGGFGIRQRVLVGSMCDIFEMHDHTHEWRREAFDLLQNLDNLEVLLVTKRITDAVYWLGDRYGDNPPEHFRLMTTCCTQQEVDENIPILLEYNGKNGVSIEPMLEELNVARYLNRPCLKCEEQGVTEWDTGAYNCPGCDGTMLSDEIAIDWIICGAESRGNHPGRLMKTHWARSLRDQCHLANVPFFLKQMHVDVNYDTTNSKTKLVKMPRLDGKVYAQFPELPKRQPELF